ncbi:YdeI family stress tolerance OB fold protein [Escherichia coli]|nr:YdeI family stress tolerance OB fold protein [Escherichia coli]
MKFQAIVLASFLVMPYALADDQGGLKQDAAPPPPHAIEDGYRGTDDAKKMTVDFAKNMHDGASVSLRGNLISHKGEDRYVFRDKSGEINVVIPAAVFDGREVQPDQMITPPPPHAIEDGYRGTDDAKKMTVDFAKNMHDGASVSLRGNLISHKGEDRYVFRDKSGEINVVIPAAVFDGREVQPDQMINISGSLDKKSAPAVVRVTHLQK